MKSLDPIRKRTREILASHPMPHIFPQEPWGYSDLEEIASIIRDHITTSDDVISDSNPYVDWLDRWYFYNNSK